MFINLIAHSLHSKDSVWMAEDSNGDTNIIPAPLETWFPNDGWNTIIFGLSFLLWSFLSMQKTCRLTGEENYDWRNKKSFFKHLWKEWTGIGIWGCLGFTYIAAISIFVAIHDLFHAY